MIAFARKVVGQTEQDWRHIHHARKVLQALTCFMGFVDFCDAESYRPERVVLRATIAA